MLAMILATTLIAQEPAQAPAPIWRSRPFPEFPAKALVDGVEGADVRLDCLLTTEGRFADCRVEADSRPDYEFAKEALKATEKARAVPREEDGVAVPGRVSFEIRFRLA
ncbi:Gram-negative bacterial tonB protein [compost metagenome]